MSRNNHNPNALPAQLGRVLGVSEVKRNEQGDKMKQNYRNLKGKEIK